MKAHIGKNYLQILRDELVPAMGCTEPIAIAFGAAKARETLGIIPERVVIEASGNIIKNVKSVTVPNTGGLKGLKAAAAAGIVAGKAERSLEVLEGITQKEIEEISAFLSGREIILKRADSDFVLDIIVTVYGGESYAKVRICHSHTNIVLIEKDGEILFQADDAAAPESEGADKSLLNVKDILEFADSVPVDEVSGVIERQIEYNTAIAREGLSGDYGASIGKALLKYCGDDIEVRARALAAAGSDARMSGCSLPVVIISGSGNQGMTASLPVIAYAEELNCDNEQLIRALVVSNLLAVHIKTGIGKLSAYCGAVCAGSAAGAAIAYLHGEDCKTVSQTLINSLAITSGIVCDGAKPSCAGKISSAVEAGLMGRLMCKEGNRFNGGDGIISDDVEETIKNIGRLGMVGMKETDVEILKIMTGE